jgi:hypothetical protein
MPGRQRKPKSSTVRRAPGPVTFETVRHLARDFPGVEDGTSYGTPALKVRGALLARLREDGETLVLKTTFVDRELLIRANPDAYFFTDHYRDYPWVLVRLSRIRPAELRERIEEAWRRVAPKRLIATFDTGVARDRAE